MDIPRYVVIDKARGETPLEALNAWRTTRPELTDLPVAYAGRLDPMASGKLLILIGDECKRQRSYHGLDKEYEIEVLLGASTDTGDTLGLPTLTTGSHSFSRQHLEKAIHTLIGTATVPYPAFSSKVVDGKPLFLRSLEGTLDLTHVPTHQETVYRIALLNTCTLTTTELAKRIQADLGAVPRSTEPSKTLGADFRQDAIRAQWAETLAQAGERSWPVVRLRVVCGSGTYMRTLASRLAEELQTQGCALSIHRTVIGRYRTLGPIGYWSKTFR